ncbi:hypothetical protein [Haloprofundus halobius]|uniref:hypothetical protein n=1 Tax=Haloprofundus halobius TaxID=2876194 RepID=UPI001CCF3968|nr:hypothetical protein [Haloprofundus halobius]
MHASGVAVRLAALLVVTTAVASGPLVSGVDFTPDASSAEIDEADAVPLGTGDASVDNVSVAADGVRLERGAYGSASYYLRMPDATARLRSVTGRPMLVYNVRIPELGYERSSTAFLNESFTADGPTTLALTLDDDPVDPERVTESSYEAEVSVLLRTQSERRVLHERTVTVEVEE